MLTSQDIKDAIKMMQKFEAENVLIQLPTGEIHNLNIVTGKTNPPLDKKFLDKYFDK